MTDLVIRPLGAGEEHLFESLPDAGLVGRQLLGLTYRELIDRHEYRPEWTWLALRDGKVVARASWWAGPKDEQPLALDWFDFTDFDAGVELLRRSPIQVGYTLALPPGWRDLPAARTEAESRLSAATAAGMEFLVERYEYRWTTACGLPARTGRLEYRADPDDDVFLDVLRRVHHGSLDAHASRISTDAGIDAAAREDLRILRWMPGPREWWRLAFTRDGELAGFAIPSRNYRHPVIAYIGVVPEQRGNGYAYDLLAEATHLLAAEGADRIIADTDTTNLPMAATFAKAGYPVERHRIDLV
jgi:RimJ/RimL family protein N-acetyltransferase